MGEPHTIEQEQSSTRPYRSDLQRGPEFTSTELGIPAWLSFLVVFSVSASLPLSLVVYGNPYLRSANGIANGGDLYSHFTEAEHVHGLLKQGMTDFWYDGITLGYPHFLAYQPLPTLLTAAFMIITERYMSTYLAFRWLFLSLVTAMPWAWFLGTRRLGMTRFQSTLVVVCLFSLHSWLDFGLELEAFRNYGLYTQAYGMAMLPLAVGYLYRYVIQAEDCRDITAVCLALNLMSHTLLGIYVICATACLLVSYILTAIASSQRNSSFRPSIPSSRPSIPNSSLNIPSSSPSIPSSSPSFPSSSPSIPSSSSSIPSSSPSIPSSSPSIPSSSPSIPSSISSILSSSPSIPSYSPSISTFSPSITSSSPSIPSSRPSNLSSSPSIPSSSPSVFRSSLSIPSSSPSILTSCPSILSSSPSIPSSSPSILSSSPSILSYRPCIPSSSLSIPSYRSSIPSYRPRIPSSSSSIPSYRTSIPCSSLSFVSSSPSIPTSSPSILSSSPSILSSKSSILSPSPSIPTSSPSIPSYRPSIQSSSPSIQRSNPSIPTSSPSIPSSRPSIPSSSPSIPTSSPSTPSSSPSIPSYSPSIPSSSPNYSSSRLNISSDMSFRGVLLRAVDVQFRSFLLSCWWLVPALANAQYIGGLPWKSDTDKKGLTINDVIRRLLSGDVYDSGRSIPIITLAVLAGLGYICLCCPFQKHLPDSSNSERGGIRPGKSVLYAWFVITFLVTLILFLGRTTFGVWYNMIPFHAEVEALRYLNGLHFLGILLSAMGFSCVILHVCRFISKLTGISGGAILVTTCIIATPMYLSVQLERTNASLSVSEVSDEISDALRNLQEHPLTGRIYAHKQFGTGGPWELALLPYFSGKPGVLTYSRGFHDTLSVFYLESLQPDLHRTPWFPGLMRLLNIRYFLANSALITDDFMEKCNLRSLSRLTNDTHIFIHVPDMHYQHYGYFEFVKIPGYITGDLKGIRKAILALTQIYTAGNLMAINPKIESGTRVPRVVVYPVINVSVPLESILNGRLLRWLIPADTFEVRWRLEGRFVAEEEWLDGVVNAAGEDGSKVRSVVLKESAASNEYSAVVEIPQDLYNKDFFSAEHLLLKVTYHPYWTCRYAKPVMITSLNRDPTAAPEHTDDEYDRWTEVPVHHVTPNLMSVVLPPGKHHVICSYHNPVYQKIGFIVFVLTVLVIFIKEIVVFIHLHFGTHSKNK